MNPLTVLLRSLTLAIALQTVATAQLDPLHSKTLPKKNTPNVDVAATEKQAFLEWAKGYSEAPHVDVVIPNAEAWFSQHFEAAVAKTLATHYSVLTRDMTGFVNAVKKTRADGRMAVKSRRASEAIDREANGLQNAALQRMIKPTPLFTMEMVQNPTSGESGTTYWSFVLVEGRYRYLGKLEPLNPTRGDLVADVLCSLPLGTAEPLLTSKGLLDEGAVDYLRKKKILK